MEIATFESQRFINRGEIFSEEIHDNNWIVFHGTSSIFEERILAQGLSWKENNHYSISVVDSIVNQYEKMYWFGEDTGGFAVLKPFSLVGDFRKSDSKPIFLAEEASSAITYASKDFAGGETARAIRKSLSDLEKYCINPKLRSNHLQKLWKALLPDPSWYHALPEYLRDINENTVTPEYYSEAWNAIHSKAPIMAKQLPPTAPKIDSIQEFLIQMEEIANKANNAINQHEYGVIFAIELTEDDLQSMEHWGAGGIVSYRLIPPQKIVGLCKIPDKISQEEWMGSTSNKVVHGRMFDRYNDPDSLVNKLGS